MPRNQPRSSRGRSAIARRVMNTGNTNGFMYQGTCVAEDGTKITPCHNLWRNEKRRRAHPLLRVLCAPGPGKYPFLQNVKILYLG